VTALTASRALQASMQANQPRRLIIGEDRTARRQCSVTATGDVYSCSRTILDAAMHRLLAYLLTSLNLRC